MGTDRSPSGNIGDLRGILVPDSRISFATLQANTGATLTSSYTQAGSKTGVAEADQNTALALLTSGGQSEKGDIEIRTQRSGGVGLENAGYVWRDVDAGDTTAQYKGWDGPQIVTAWETLQWTTLATGTNLRPHVIRLASGELLAAYDVSALGVLLIKRYDPATAAWTSANLTPTGAATTYLAQAVALCQLPSGRVLCFVTAFDEQQVDAYYSDDDGATWSAYGYRILDTAVAVADVRGLRAAYSAGEILLLVEYVTGAGNETVAQYASSDLGTAFTQVEDDWFANSGERPHHTDIEPLIGSGFLLSYLDTTPASTDFKARRTGSAFTLFSDATAITITAEALDNAATIWRDEDSTIYALYHSSMSGNLGVLKRSVDDGATWSTFAEPARFLQLHTGTSIANRFQSWSATTIAGRTALITRWTAAGSSYDPMSVGVIWLGGFSTHTAPASDNAGSPDYKDTDFIGWGDQLTSGNPGGLYLPATTPDNVDWTAAGAGTEALTASTNEITTTAGQTRYYERLHSDSDNLALFAEIAVEITEGDGSKASDEITARFRLNNTPTSTWEYEVTIRMSYAGYRLYDEVAAAVVGGDVAADLTSRVHIRIAIDRDGNVRTWHAKPDHVRSWTEGITGTLSDAGVGSAAESRIRWGHTGAAANVSRWAMIGYCFWPGRWSGQATGKLAAAWTNPDHLHARSYPTTLATVHDTVRIAAADGPTRYGETQRIAADYDYPARHAFPEIDPSPRVRWRTTDDESIAVLTWDLNSLANSRMLNHSIGCFLLGTNLRTAALEYYDGAAWQTLISLDGAEGWDPIKYTRTGDIVHVQGGAAQSSRWLGYGQAVGGTFQLDGSTLREIVEHSEGAWEDGTTKHPWMRLRGITGAEPVSGSAGRIIMPSFGSVRHEWDSAARYLRLKIPSQITAQGYYEIGQIVVGHLVIMGYQWSRGFSRSTRANVLRSTWRDGQTRVQRLGPVARTFELAWTDGTDSTQLAGTAADPDYVAGSASGLPVAARSDGPRLLEGLLADSDGPARPLLLLPAIPRGTGSKAINVGDGLVWGRIGEEISRDHVVGDELSSEVERSSKIVFRELV